MSDTIGHFSIYGDFEAAEITAALGLQPSNVRSKGTWIEGADRPAKVEEWELYCPQDLTMHEQITFLLGQLWPRADSLRSSATMHRADFNISGEGSEILQLSPEELSKLVGLHVYLNCFFSDKGEHAN